MQSKSKIKYSSAAVDDMDEIFSYISLDNIAAAEMLLAKLDREIKKLDSFPNMGSLLPEDEYTIVQPGYRFIIINPYLVFYRLINNSIIIYRILHGRRDYLRELFKQIE